MTTYYSQKTGSWSDSSAWNTARDGSGSSGIPGAGDAAVIQNGHTISSDSAHTVGSVSVESGGSWARGTYTVVLRGNLTNAGSISGTGPVAFQANATLTLTEAVEFTELIISVSASVTTSSRVTAELLEVEGSLTVAELDVGVLIIRPGGSLSITGGSAEAAKVINHGTLSTTPTLYYSDYYVNDGSVTGSVVHTSYHSTAQTVTISESTRESMKVSGISITRDPLRAAMAKIVMENTPEARGYLLGRDTLQISEGGTTLFRGKLWKREVGEDRLTLTAYDHLFDLGKTYIPGHFYGNLYDDKVVPVTPGFPETISVPGVTDKIVPPAARIRFLRTRAKNLREDSTPSHKITVGYDITGTTMYGAQYYDLPEDAGRIMRFAVFIGNKNTGGNFLWWIYDVTPGSPNYDSVIASGSIPNSAVSSGAPTWVVVDVAADYGIVPAPRRIKLVIGDNDDHANWSTCDWYGTFIAPYALQACKTSTTGATESDLEIYTTTSGSDTVSLWLSSEIECSGDWDDERDPVAEFTYSSTTLSHNVAGTAPISTNNRTRDNGDGTWNVCRITIFYDPPTPEEYVKNIVNDWGRYAFSQIDVSLTTPSWKRPYLLITGASVLAVLRTLAEESMAEFWHIYESSQDVFRARDKKESADWSSYSEAEQAARLIISPRAVKGYGPIDQAEYERMVRRKKTETAEDLVRRVFAEGDFPAAYTDFSEDPPYWARGENLKGWLIEQLEAAKQLVDELVDPGEDRSVNGVEIHETVLHTNELVKLVDDLTGMSTVAKVTRVESEWDEGGWRTKVRANDAVRSISASSPEWWKRTWLPWWWEQRRFYAGISDDLKSLLEGITSVLAVWDLTTSCPSGTYYIHVGSSNASPGSNTMQTTSNSEKAVAMAERVEVGGKVYLRAAFNRDCVVGEWEDVLNVREIGVSTSSTWGSSILTRVVLDVPAVTDVGYAGDLITSSKTIYHPPGQLTSQGRLVVIFTLST